MKRWNWQATLGVSLVVLSAVIYFIHYFAFRDLHHILIYLVGDLAFVPIEVLLVTVIIHRLLSERERRSRLEKLNMVIGAFFSEVGTSFLAVVSDADPQLEEIRSDLLLPPNWSDPDYRAIDTRLRVRKYAVDISKIDIPALKDFLGAKRDFLLRLLENPSLLEHESFTDLLRAVFHLSEELTSREDLGSLPDTDLKHLAGDAARAYACLVDEWLDYMKHLRDFYPYLFSLAIRTNPFDQDATPVVQ
jgi:hypothetical protein